MDVVLLGPTPGLEESRIGICVGTLAVGRISDASERRYGEMRTIGVDAVVVITGSGRSTRLLRWACEGDQWCSREIVGVLVPCVVVGLLEPSSESPSKAALVLRFDARLESVSTWLSLC